MGKMRKILALALSISLVSGIVMLDTKDCAAATGSYSGRASRNNTQVKSGVDTKKNRADYDTITYTGPHGEKVNVYVSGSDLRVDSADGNFDLDFIIADYDEMALVTEASGNGSISIDCSDLEPFKAYYIDSKIDYGEYESGSVDVVISVDDSKNAFFVKPPCLETNRERMKKLDLVGDPYENFLGSQVDIECDDPEVIRFSKMICRGCDTDYDKVLAIYSFITGDMYYDFNQVYIVDKGYQDDVLSLLRRKIGVCEGFSNVFVALCRAQGVPATEIYGYTNDYDWFWTTKDFSDPSIISNHAWVTAYIDGQWLVLDPTWDNSNQYMGQLKIPGRSSRDFVFLPLEVFSYTHLFQNCDFSHSVPQKGSCGPDATFEITQDGVCTIYGEGAISMPGDAKDFFVLVFDEKSEITSIDEFGFVDCDQIRRIEFPDTLEYIGDYAFMSCEDLEYVVFPNGLRSIGQDAFSTCDKLAFCSIPTGTSVGMRCFDYCPRLIVEISDKNAISLRGYTVKPARLVTRN
ncbi:MAG: leucine-rich repeat protein [Clostridiales bacterium]|nr:leucine-rich repeat protein [Clostridiales bacterium]